MPELNATPLNDHPAAAALAGLLEGNGRFVAAEPRYARDVDAARRAAPDQRPDAVVFTCIDSRVNVEAAFDCDFGQLLSVRTAGHVSDRAAVESLEFSAAELGVSLLVVLGHERCGAIAAALQAVEAEADAGYLVEQLRDAASQALAEAGEGRDTAAHALRLQVRRTVEELRGRSSLEGVLVVGAVYDLDTGVVSLVDEN